jgi:predicted TPR repeat methyltransferase
MLEVARERAVYDELVEAEIIEYLRGQSPQYHVLIASDVLTYLGDLAEFFQAAARALLLGGMVVLTVELLQDAGTYQLNPTGRFSHSERYLRSALEDAGFVVKLLDNDVMRHEASRPVPSLVAVGEVTAG